MASILHGNATTTPRVRKEIQDSTESIAKLAKRYGINEKTVLKWKHRSTTVDHKTGPKVRPSVLTPLEQQIICRDDSGMLIWKTCGITKLKN